MCGVPDYDIKCKGYRATEATINGTLDIHKLTTIKNELMGLWNLADQKYKFLTPNLLSASMTKNKPVIKKRTIKKPTKKTKRK